MVGQTIGGKRTQLGHDVKLGSWSATNEKTAKWITEHGARASQGAFADVAEFGEAIFNCTSGDGALAAAGVHNLAGTVK